MRLLAIAIAIALVSCVTTGCFVFDELDSGLAIMDQHSRKKPEEPKPAAQPSDSSGSSFLSGIDVAGQFRKFQDKVGEAMAKPPDPDNTLVHCEVEGRVRFTRKYDCQALGGRLVMR
ncbi:MAG: hypothetical protein JRG96_11705 [Deltaproteobacteria bacterium]|nr:hypothetical protein [Deltaproteobacteria bacterium]MBW2419280.1 hypothetical protein [Deltaproteobacteria bacterium]